MRPLAFPTPGAGGEAVITGLLPSAHPLLFVPPDFSERLLRWPSLAHELGHLMHDALPGLPEELSQITGLQAQFDKAGNLRAVLFDEIQYDNSTFIYKKTVSWVI
jgi:hypothetical protein